MSRSQTDADPMPKDWARAPRTMNNQELLPHEQAVSNNGPRTARP